MTLLESIKNATHLLLVEKLIAPFGQVNLPSYAGAKAGDNPRYVAWETNGAVNAVLDSIQSQANRMEPIFNEYPELVPATTVAYPNATVPLVDIPHRAADAAIRYHFASELEALAAGNPVPLAKRNPTALIFGLWDSRRTMVKVQRALTSSVQVRGAVHQPAASSLTSPFDTDTRLKLKESGWSQDDLSQIGVGEVPSYREKGTVDTSSACIERRVFLPMSLFNMYEGKLQNYLRGLALVALLYPVSLELRSGTSLVRESRSLTAFGDGFSTAIALDNAFEDALKFARASAKAFGIGKAETLTVDLAKIGEGIREFQDKKAKKSGKAKGAEVGSVA